MTKILSYKSDVDLDYPICRPSLDLDFTQEVLDKRITFTRGSIGTRVNRNRLIETVSANQPRFDYDPVTGECKGLLIEESRANSWLYSGQSVTTGWSSTASTLSFDNTQTAPDGSTNTIKFTERAVYTGGMGFNQTLSVTSGTSYTFSIFAKQPTGSPTRYCTILLFNTGFGELKLATFNPTNGSVLYTGGTLTTSVQKYPNGWWRFAVTGTATATTTSQFSVRFTNSLSSSANPPYGYGGPYGNYTGDGSSYLYFFGPQVENGAFMTSYIPTSASTVTRSADNASMTGTNFSSWYNQSEGSIYLSSIPYYSSSVNAFNRLLSINDNSGSQNTVIQILTSNATNAISNSFYINSTYQGGNNKTIFSGTKFKLASSFSSSNISICFDGSNLASNKRPSFTLPTFDRMSIGSYNNNLICTMHLSRLTYYPRRLKDNQLLYLTQ